MVLVTNFKWQSQIHLGIPSKRSMSYFSKHGGGHQLASNI